MMAPSHLDLPQTQPSSSQVVPILCLLGVVALLSSITPTLKYVLQHSGLTFLSIAGGRIIIGFLFLVCITAYQDWRELRALDVIEGARLGALGLLGVGSYAIAAYGLMYTNVTHYALVYSLLPTFTALFSWCLAREHLSFFSLLGIVLSWTGCLIALGRNFESGTIDLGLGDALVFLFTLMMAAHLVLSMHIVRRHGVLTANTAMFATSAVLVSGCTVAWGEPAPPIHLTWTIWGAVLFIGLGHCHCLPPALSVPAVHDSCDGGGLPQFHSHLHDRHRTPITGRAAHPTDSQRGAGRHVGNRAGAPRASPVHLFRKECLDAARFTRVCSSPAQTNRFR